MCVQYICLRRDDDDVTADDDGDDDVVDEFKRHTFVLAGRRTRR